MRTELWQYASRLTGLAASNDPATNRVLWANYNFSTPPRTYATIQIINSQSNNPSQTAPDNNGDSVMHLDTTFTLQIQVYADATPFEAFDIVDLASKRAKLISEQQALRAGGLAFVEVLSVNDAPALIGTTWESRAIIDLQLRTLTAITDEVGLIEKVEVDGSVDGINVNVTIEV